MRAQRGTMRQWRHGLVVAGASLLALLIALALVKPALAATVSNVDIPLSGTVINPCNGETIFFSGIDHFTLQITVNNGGGYHYSIHDNIHVTATGDQGNTYIGNQEDYSDHNFTGSSEATSTLSFSEISQGSAPNFEMTATQHITFTPAGIATANFLDYRAACRG